jgi:hypothetical protein
VRCVVLESGGGTLERLGSDSFDETVVVTQLASEPSLVFAERAMAKLASAERSGKRVQELTLLTGRRHDEAARAARRLVALRLSAHAQASASVTELILQTPSESDGKARDELLELAGEVTGASSAPILVRLRFGDPEPQSGVFQKPCAPPRAGSESPASSPARSARTRRIPGL